MTEWIAIDAPLPAAPEPVRAGVRPCTPARRLAFVRRHLDKGILLTGLAGLLIATITAGVVGLRDVGSSVQAIGARGLTVLVLWSPVPCLLLGGAWFALAAHQAPGKLRSFVWARLVRDSAGELLPFSHLGGFFFGARAAVLSGVDTRTAVSTTVADMTAELLAQLGFTGLGLALLLSHLGGDGRDHALAAAAAAGLVLSAAGAVAFIAIQRRGGRLVERLADRIMPSVAGQVSDLSEAIRALYDAPGRILAGVALHFAAWTASATGVWLALRAAGVEADLTSILAIESLVAAARSALIIAPMGLGVQEAAYALAAPVFGLTPELALALSLVKRARDLIVGAPALMGWQAMEGARVLGRRRAPPTALLRPEAPAPAQG